MSPTPAPSREAQLKAFSQGFKAAMNGKAMTENPYRFEEARSAWERGFREFTEKSQARKGIK